MLIFFDGFRIVRKTLMAAKHQQPQEKTIMATFTIDSENNIVAHLGTAAGGDNQRLSRLKRNWRNPPANGQSGA
jgi:hypothetical protein